MAPRLAELLGCAWEDLDDRIVRLAGRSIADVFREEGEGAFRSLEHRALEEALTEAAEGSRRVIACGGGIVTHAASRARLAASALVVWLTVRPETALERVGSAAPGRPLLAADDVPGRMRSLAAERDPLYRDVAVLTVATDGRSPEDVAAAAATAIRDRWATSAS